MCEYWQSLFVESDSQFYGWVRTYEAAEEVIRRYEIETNTQFTKAQSSGAFRSKDPSKHGHHIRFEDCVTNTQVLPFLRYDSIPFMNVNVKRWKCSRGKDRHKLKLNEIEEKGFDHDYAPKRKRIVEATDEEEGARKYKSKKVDCQAQIMVRQIIKYPEYAIQRNTKFLREQASKKLRSALRSGGDKTLGEARFYVILARSSAHTNHLAGEEEECLLTMDKKLKQRISQLVSEGVDSTSEVREELARYVQSEREALFSGGNLPPQTNSRFYPSVTHIRTHINLAKYRLSKTGVTFVKRQKIVHDQPDLQVAASPPASPNVDAGVGDDHDDNAPTEDQQDSGMYSPAEDCRVLLDEIRAATYFLEQPETLTELHEKLESIRVWLSNTQVADATSGVCPTAGGEQQHCQVLYESNDDTDNSKCVAEVLCHEERRRMDIDVASEFLFFSEDIVNPGLVVEEIVADDWTIITSQ